MWRKAKKGADGVAQQHRRQVERQSTRVWPLIGFAYCELAVTVVEALLDGVQLSMVSGTEAREASHH
jgi:hypothetical protein